MKSSSVAVLAVCALVSLRAAQVEPSLRSTTLAMTSDGEVLTVVNEDSDSISILTRDGVAEVPVCSTPRTVALLGPRAFVPCGDGRIARVDLETQRVESMGEAGVDPFGVIAFGGRLFVSDHGASEVRALDPDTLETLASTATEAYPRGLAFDPNARRLYVTHFPTGRVTVIDPDSLKVITVLSTGADTNLSQSITIAGGRAYLPQTRSNTANRALLFDNTVFPVVTVLDLATGAVLTRDRVSLDIVDQPVNMPLDAVVTSEGTLYVVNAGSDDLSVVDLESQQTVAHVDVGTNPRGIALSPDESFVYVSNALSGSVSVIDTSTNAISETITTTKIPLPPSLLRGKILFHSSASPDMAKDEWISCATCHFEGGADGRTWFFRDGIRNTPALFGISSTLPMHWSGDLDELQDVESTIRVVQAGTGLAQGDSHCLPACDEPRPNARRSRDLDDLATFMTTLRAPRRKVRASAEGEARFNEQCASCHPAPFYTDRRKHEVGTGSAFERKGTSFDTPSLRGVFDTAPYLHDGSAATIREAILRHTSASAADAEELARFVESLPYPQVRRRSVR